MIILEKTKNVRELPLKREVQAVKSILQGGSSTVRDHSDSQHSKEMRHGKHDDKQTKQKKRNLLEVFKKPSNAKDIGKPIKQRPVPHVVDKFELECIEVLKVWLIQIQWPFVYFGPGNKLISDINIFSISKYRTLQRKS